MPPDSFLNELDLIMLAVVAVSALLAARRGFTAAALGLGVWIGAAVVAVYGFAPARPLARAWIESPLLADMAAGAGLFIGGLMVLGMARGAVSGMARDGAAGALDRAMGLVFGAARGALLICVAWIAATLLWSADDLPPSIASARGMPYVEALSAPLAAWLPESLRERVAAAADAARHHRAAVGDAGALLEQLGIAPDVDARIGGGGSETAPPSTPYSAADRAALEKLIEEESAE